MKTVKQVYVLIVSISLFVSCKKTSQQQISTYVIGKMGTAGVPAVTVEPTDLLPLLQGSFDIQSVDDVNIRYTHENLLMLETRGPAKNGTYITIGSIVTVNDAGLIMLSGSCSQSCTSVAPCNGCTLTISSDCSGYCDCSSGFGGSCTHTVKTKDEKII